MGEIELLGSSIRDSEGAFNLGERLGLVLTFTRGFFLEKGGTKAIGFKRSGLAHLHKQVVHLQNNLTFSIVSSKGASLRTQLS